MADSKEKLFSDFPGVSTEAWMEKITADLKGADFEKKLGLEKPTKDFKVKTILSPGRSGRFENKPKDYPENCPLCKKARRKTTILGSCVRKSK
mgnify:CR=1 FL=1